MLSLRIKDSYGQSSFLGNIMSERAKTTLPPVASSYPTLPQQLGQAKGVTMVDGESLSHPLSPILDHTTIGMTDQPLPSASARIASHKSRLKANINLSQPPLLPPLPNRDTSSSSAKAIDSAVDDDQLPSLSQRQLQDIWKHVRYLLTAQVSRTTCDQVINRLEFVSFDKGVFRLGSTYPLALTTAQEYHSTRILDIVRSELPEAYHPLAIEFTLISPHKLPSSHDAMQGENPLEAPHLVTRQTENLSKLRNGDSAKGESKTNAKNVLPCPYQADEAFAPFYQALGLPLHSGMGFDDFIVDESNALAEAAAQKIINALGTDDIWASLVIYGEHGCGKTHLLQSIGWALHQQRPDLKFIFFRTHSFKHQFSKFMKTPAHVIFHDMMRDMDVLLIDDIHQLPNKHGPSCEEFLNLISDMRANGKTVIMTSVSHPAQLTSYSIALRSRLQESRIAEVKPPSEALQLAVLRRHADKLGLKHKLDDHGLMMMINRIQGGFRVLIGQLATIAHEASQQDGQWTSRRLGEFLDRQLGSQRRVSIFEIITHCCRLFGVSRAEFMSRRRHRTLTLCRHTAMYMAKELTQKSLPEIGRDLGKLDHTSVLYGIRRINQELENNPNFVIDLNDLKDRLLYGEASYQKD